MASASPSGKREATSSDEQVKFLLTCIKTAGTTFNWETVANELGLPSKGAAAKRFERLQKAHSMHASQTGAPSPPKKTADNVDVKTKGKPASKKRSADGDDKQPAKKVKNEDD